MDAGDLKEILNEVDQSFFLYVKNDKGYALVTDLKPLLIERNSNNEFAYCLIVDTSMSYVDDQDDEEQQVIDRLASLGYAPS